MFGTSKNNKNICNNTEVYDKKEDDNQTDYKFTYQ